MALSGTRLDTGFGDCNYKLGKHEVIGRIQWVYLFCLGLKNAQNIIFAVIRCSAVRRSTHLDG